MSQGERFRCARCRLGGGKNLRSISSTSTSAPPTETGPTSSSSVRARARRSLMAMVGGLDLHRRQITFDVVEVESGLEWRGRIWQPDRERFRRWLGNEVTSRARGGRVALAVEGCTGWRYVA